MLCVSIPGSSGFCPLRQLFRQFPAVPAVPDSSSFCPLRQLSQQFRQFLAAPAVPSSSDFCPLRHLSWQFWQFRLLPFASTFPTVLAVSASALYVNFPRCCTDPPDTIFASLLLYSHPLSCNSRSLSQLS